MIAACHIYWDKSACIKYSLKPMITPSKNIVSLYFGIIKNKK